MANKSSPVFGRPREFDRGTALLAAMEVFWRKGFLAASMNDLCAAMGIRSPSLYAAFGSKENLYVEAVGQYDTIAREKIWDHLEADGPALAGLRKALVATAGIMAGGPGNPTGCMVTLAAGEDCPGAVPETAQRTRLAGFTRLRARFKRAVAAGELPRGTDIDRLARFYLGIIQGMAVQGRDGASEKELAGMVDTALAAWPGR